MSFTNLLFDRVSEEDMARASSEFVSFMRSRRSVREFSDQDISIEVIKNIVSAAAAAPSGANKEPWHFTIVKDPSVKRKIRVRAEKEEKSFYTQRATYSWLEDLNKFGTDWRKKFLEVAPCLVVVFKQILSLIHI